MFCTYLKNFKYSLSQKIIKIHLSLSYISKFKLDWFHWKMFHGTYSKVMQINYVTDTKGHSNVLLCWKILQIVFLLFQVSLQKYSKWLQAQTRPLRSSDWIEIRIFTDVYNTINSHIQLINKQIKILKFSWKAMLVL